MKNLFSEKLFIEIFNTFKTTMNMAVDAMNVNVSTKRDG